MLQKNEIIIYYHLFIHFVYYYRMSDVDLIFRYITKDTKTGKIIGNKSKNISTGKHFPFSRHHSVKGGMNAFDKYFKKNKLDSNEQWIIGVTYKIHLPDAKRYGIERCYGTGPDKVWDSQIGLTETFNSDLDSSLTDTALRCIEEEVGLTTNPDHINEIHDGQFGNSSKCTLFVIDAKNIKHIDKITIKASENARALDRYKKAEVFIHGTYDEIKNLIDCASYISLVAGCKDVQFINGLIGIPYNMVKTLRNEIDTLPPNGNDFRPYFWPEGFPSYAPACFSKWKPHKYIRPKFIIGPLVEQVVA